MKFCVLFDKIWLKHFANYIQNLRHDAGKYTNMKLITKLMKIALHIPLLLTNFTMATFLTLDPSLAVNLNLQYGFKLGKVNTYNNK